MSAHPQLADQLPTLPLRRYYLENPPFDEDAEEAWADGTYVAWVDAPDPAQATHMAAILFGPLWPGDFTHAAWIDADGSEHQSIIPTLKIIDKVRALIDENM